MTYLGANEAAFRLGNQVVSVYLGAVEVYSPVSVLYFNGQVDSEWTELGNWWQDAGHTVPATALPTAADSVIASASISSNNGGEPTVLNLTIESGLEINITVTGMATFNGDIAFLFATLTGNATFNGLSANAGTVTGNATFNGDAFNHGTITGDATFNEASFNGGGSPSLVGGDATFNDNSGNESEGDVTGTATFTGNAVNCNGTAGTFVPNPPPSC